MCFKVNLISQVFFAISQCRSILKHVVLRMRILINLSFEKLRSLEADVTGAVRTSFNLIAPQCEWKQFFEFRTIIQSIVNGSNALF
jgi:hypothetical protein